MPADLFASLLSIATAPVVVAQTVAQTPETLTHESKFPPVRPECDWHSGLVAVSASRKTPPDPAAAAQRLRLLLIT